MDVNTRAPWGLPRRSGAARRRVLLFGIAVAVTAAFAQRASQAQQPQPYTKWDQYGGSADSMQYSALAQINKTNVTQLQRAWFYPVPGEPDRLVFNPLIVDNVMYVSGRRRRHRRARRDNRQAIVDVDACARTERGLAYWESKDRSDRRLIVDRQQRHPRSRRAHRPADHDVRQQRVRRHARRRSRAATADRATARDAFSRTCSSSDRTPASCMDRRRETSARMT